jgi:gliding motility-associated-like protein
MKPHYLTYIFRCALTIWLIVQGVSVTAQRDTVFWFAAPEISSGEGDAPVYLRFTTYADAAVVTVTQPANGAFAPIVLNIPANDVDSINLTPFLSDVESSAADIVDDNGLKISSTEEITAIYELNHGSNKELFSLKGTKGIGTNFYTPFQKTWDNAVTAPVTGSAIDIVATEDGTTVLITPRTDVVGHTGSITYSVTLNEGETYSARDMNVSASTSLAGSIVASDKPIAVTCFSGALSNSGCTSSMGDQITTADYAGKDFIVHRGHNDDERIFILATQNATSINITNNGGTTSTLINWSETYAYELTDTINYIETSKPVYLWHASGSGCNLAGAQVPNLFCAGRYSTSFTRSSADSLALILYTRSGFENDFALNGNGSLIPGSAFTVVPGTSGEFVVASIQLSTADVPLNSYNEVTNTGDVFGMAILNGSHTNGSKFAYLSEFNSYPFVSAGADATICGNTTLPLAGIVGGGTVTGYWSGTGFGSFDLDQDSLTNTYIPSPLDTIISPIELILTSTGPCPVKRDTIVLTVTPGPIVNASADQTVCANNAQVLLDGSISGGASTGEWSTLGSGTFVPDSVTLDAVYIPSAADTVAGSVTLVLTSTNVGSCNVATDTMVVTITGAPTVDAGVDTIWVCSNNPDVALSGSVSGPTSSGKWTTSGSGLFVPDNLLLNTTYQPSPSDVNAGSIMLYLESTNNGTCSTAKDSLTVIFTASPTVEAGVNIIACTNEPAVQLSGLIGGPTTTGGWTGGLGTFTADSSDLNAIYTPTAAEISSGSLILTLETTNNLTCVSESDIVQIDFVSPPFANFNFTQVCLNETTDFTDFSLPGYGTITNWDWDFADASTSTNQNETHTYATPGAYDVELIVTTNVGCTDTTVKTVNVWELPNAGFNYSTNCNGSQVIIDFTDNSSSANDTINYWFYDFGGQGTAAAQNPSQLFIGDGDFVITQIVSTTHGCVDSIVDIITIPPRPTAGFFYNTSNGLNIGAEFSFIDTSSNAVDYFWEFGDGNTSFAQDPSNVYLANGTYTVTQYVTGALGCEDSISSIIQINTVTTEITRLIPNAISPNGDGKNDVWKLEFVNLLYPDATVEIYNRWGQQIFNSVGYTEPWDGKYNGDLVPDGTYYYVINLNDSSEPEPFKGSVLVLKSVNN